MSDILIPHKKRQLKLLIFFVVIVVATIFIWIFYLYEPAPISDIETTDGLNNSANPNDLESLSDVLYNHQNGNFKVFKKTDAGVGPVGRGNPFVPY